MDKEMTAVAECQLRSGGATRSLIVLISVFRAGDNKVRNRTVPSHLAHTNESYVVDPRARMRFALEARQQRVVPTQQRRPTGTKRHSAF